MFLNLEVLACITYYFSLIFKSCLIGFPSVGKSTLLTKITKTSSEIAAYEFTTLTCIPGVIEYKGCKL